MSCGEAEFPARTRQATLRLDRGLSEPAPAGIREEFVMQIRTKCWSAVGLLAVLYLTRNFAAPEFVRHFARSDQLSRTARFRIARREQNCNGDRLERDRIMQTRGDTAGAVPRIMGL